MVNNSKASKKTSKALLCESIESDIRRRGLRSGDAYLTAAEAAEQLGVSRATAHRAFQELAARDILISRQRAGTVVGSGTENWYANSVALPTAHIRILLVQQRIREGNFFEDLLRSLHHILPGREVTISYVPNEGGFEFVKEILDQTTDRKTGYLVLGCPRSVHELLAEIGATTVILGPTVLTASNLPSVSADNRQRGRLMTEYLLNRDHKRTALLMPETWLPGDIEVYEGVNETLTEQQIPHGTLTLCNSPQEEKSLQAELRRLFEAPSPPTAIICKQRSVQIVEKFLADLPNNGAKEVEVLVEVTDVNPELKHSHTHTSCIASLRQRATKAAEMLKTLLAGNELEETHVKFPVEISIRD